MKPSGVGGMAVMEGVMMRNKDEYAVAVRKPNNEIAVEKCEYKDISNKVKLFKLPIFRGMLAFVDSMVIGVKVLNYSASFFEEDEEDVKSKKKNAKKDKSEKKAVSIDSDFEIEEVSDPHDQSKSRDDEALKDSAKKDDTTLMMVFAVMLSIVLSVALFMVLPVLLTQVVSHFVKNTFLMNLIEGIIRLAIFIGYVMLASLMPEIKRTFMYHGAEHKTINCLENGCELTVENVKKHSKQHKRCGTSFMLLVILISLVFFMIIPTGNLIWRVLSRILLVPFIAGVSYEFIRLAGKSENKLVDILSKPGLLMQGLTTKEPDDTMIEVAIKSVDAVFDWRAFLDEYKKDAKKANGVAKKQPVQKSTGVNNSSTEKQNSTSKQSSGSKQSNTEKQSSTVKQSDNTVKQTDTDKRTSTVKPVSAANKSNNLKPVDNAKKDSTVKGNASYKDNTAPSKRRSFDEDEEDDEILKALDKYFDSRNDKAAGGK